ncbi:MAG: STAS/SEC14 domain-containing protein, partial [Bacteroidota bacterium]
EETGQLNYMLVLDTSVKNFTAGAWWQDALLGLKNITKWNRVAIVSDSDGINSFTGIYSVFIPGEFRGFYPEQLKVAIDWVSGIDIES